MECSGGAGSAWEGLEGLAVSHGGSETIAAFAQPVQSSASAELSENRR